MAIQKREKTFRKRSEGYPISLIPTQILIDANGKPYNPKDPEAMQLNPALVIDEKVVSFGKVLKPKEIVKILENSL